MTHIDKIIVKRLASRIGLVILVFYGLIILVESLDSWRFSILSNTKGQSAAIMAIFAAGARWSIKILPITILLGAILAILDLQSHKEMIIIKANGISIWRILLAPVIVLLIISFAIIIFLDTKVIEINRSLFPAYQTSNSTIGKDGQIWLVQYEDDKRYILQGRQGANGVNNLINVAIFMPLGSKYSQIYAASAQLKDKYWLLENVTLFAPNKQSEKKSQFQIATKSTISELSLKLTPIDDFTFFDLQKALKLGLSDPQAQASAASRYAKLLAMPFLLVGILLIAFAFSMRFSRNDSYASAIVTGIVLGFVVFVLTEMADRAGSSGILNPLIAGWGPSFVAIIIGASILLYKEDGQVL